MKSSPQTKLISIGIILIAAVLGIIFFAVLPLMSKINEKKNQSFQLRQDLIAIDEEINDYRTAIDELARIEDSIQVFQQVVPQREDMVSLVQGLESAVALAGAEHELFITDEAEEKLKQGARRADPNATPVPPIVPGLAGVAEVPYELQLNTDYQGFVDFLYYFRRQPFVSKFKDLAVVADTQQNQLTEEVVNLGTAAITINGVFFIREQE